MPATTPEKKAYNAQHALANKNKKGLLDAIRSILSGRRTQAKTLKKYGWTLTQVNRIRSLDPRFKAVLEDTHSIDLDKVYKGTALPPLNALAADVQEQPAPAPPPVPKYDQGLVDTPAKGTNTPISWRQIDTFWAGDVDKHEMGSNAVRKVMKDGELVAAKYKRSTRAAKRTTFNQIRTHYKASWDDNAIPVMKQASQIMAWFRKELRKTEVQIERDQTVMDSAEGAVAGRDADDDDEVSSGAVSRAANVVRARSKSEALKEVKASYSNKLGDIISTMRAWKVFGDSIGSNVLQEYEGTFDEGQLGFKQAKQAVQEAAGNRTKNALQAVPSHKLLLSFLPKIKEIYGATSPAYLACYLQVHLFGLRDNLGGVEIRETNGGFYDPSVGDSSRRDWYNKNTGQLYISHFKTQGSSAGRPYDFLLKGDVRRTVDTTLAPGAPKEKRKWLVDIGVGGEKHQDRAGLPLPVGSKISSAFAKGGLIYMSGKSGQLKATSPGPLDIRHAQDVAKYEEYKRKEPNLTETHLSDRIVVFFNHGSDISRGYIRIVFDSLNDPLATKKGVSPNAVASTPAPAQPAQLPPIEESEDSGESGESGGGADSSGGKSSWGAKGSRSARRPRKAAPKSAAPKPAAPKPTPALRQSTRARRAPARK